MIRWVKINTLCLLMSVFPLSVVADNPLTLFIKVSNDSIQFTAGHDDNVIAHKAMSTRYPSLWWHPPTFAFEVSPFKFFDLMSEQLAEDLKGKDSPIFDGYDRINLYIAAAGYRAPDKRTPEDRTTIDKYIQALEKQVQNKKLDSATPQRIRELLSENPDSLELNYKGDIFAELYKRLLTQKLGITIDNMVVEGDAQFCASLGLQCIESKQNNKNDPYFVLQATTLANPQFIDEEQNKTPQDWWDHPADGCSNINKTGLGYLGGSYEAGLNYQAAINSKEALPAFEYLSAKLKHTEKVTKATYPDSNGGIANLIKSEKISKNNCGSLIMGFASLSEDEREKESHQLGLDKEVIAEAMAQSKTLIEPLRKNALISLLTLYQLLPDVNKDKARSLVIVDDYATFLAEYDSRNLKTLYSEKLSENKFQDDAYDYYISAMMKQKKSYLSKENYISALKELKFWDVQFENPDQQQSLRLKAAEKRLSKYLGH